MNNELPNFLLDLLNNQYDNETVNKIIEGYSVKRYPTLRINNLLSNKEEIINFFNANKIEYKNVSYDEDAFIILNKTSHELLETCLCKEGKIYLQSLSSMLPPFILEPLAGNTILDMAAAPGGKTTQMSSMTHDKAFITAVEVNKIRAERLKYNVSKQGCKNVFVMQTDAKRLDDFFSFDQILLDAPCSGSGTIDLNIGLKGFSYELVKNSSNLQYQLLKKAVKILKPGQTMVYSTCSILQQENEMVVNKILKETSCEIVPIHFFGMENLPLLKSSIEGTLLVMPNELYEGFFVCKIKKNK